MIEENEIRAEISPYEKGRIACLAFQRGLLATPERLTLTQALKLANAVRDGYGELMATALEQSRDRDFASQWELLTSVIREAEEFGLAEPDPVRPGRPRRVLNTRRGVIVRRERIREGWVLRFTGPEATGMLIDGVLDEIERQYSS